MTKHKRAARIVANDGDGHQVKITVEVISDNGLMVSEVQQLRTDLARNIARNLETMKFTDFGPENTRVSMLKRL